MRCVSTHVSGSGWTEDRRGGKGVSGGGGLCSKKEWLCGGANVLDLGGLGCGQVALFDLRSLKKGENYMDMCLCV